MLLKEEMLDCSIGVDLLDCSLGKLLIIGAEDHHIIILPHLLQKILNSEPLLTEQILFAELHKF